MEEDQKQTLLEAIAEIKELLETVLEVMAGNRKREELVMAGNRKREELLEEKLENLTGGMRKLQPERSRLGVMGRNAKRAGMTLAQWILHCEENDHPVMRMDRSIVNHSRGEYAPADSEKGKALRESRRKLAAVRARSDGGTFEHAVNDDGGGED